jgi:hypothetical protein
MSSLASIRAQVEQRLSGRVAAPFTFRPPDNEPVLPSGIPTVDILGGIPCGAITEIVGPRWCSVGRKTIQTQLLGRATQDRLCALIDATDSFDPTSARAGGVCLKRLLWIRCRGRELRALEQAFKSVDLILQGGGGFGLVLLDLAALSEKCVQKIPMSTWFRFRAVVEKLSAALVVLTAYRVAGTCSSLTVNLSGASVRWSQSTPNSPAHARLSAGLDFAAQIANRRSPKKPSQSVRTFSAERQWGQSS